MHSTCIDRTTKAARRYVSPRTRPLTSEEAQTRALAYMLKDPDCDQDMIDAAAREMARLIEGERGYLVPVPSHKRCTKANRRLANAVAHTTGYKFKTADILSRKEPAESTCERHRKRLPPLPAEAHQIFLAYPYKVTLTGTDKIYFVDNVITSGNTIEACRRAMLGLGTGLVYADAHHAIPNRLAKQGTAK
jgi:predicted amidophosphoribosyltransferase